LGNSLFARGEGCPTLGNSLFARGEGCPTFGNSLFDLGGGCPTLGNSLFDLGGGCSDWSKPKAPLNPPEGGLFSTLFSKQNNISSRNCILFLPHYLIFCNLFNKVTLFLLI